MHTNENVYDTFIPRWFGRTGNNIQQISNGIYFCRENKIKFSSPDHPLINSIELNFGDTNYKIHPSSTNWFYFFNGRDADFETNVQDLNYNRKRICEEYIYPKLKIDHSISENSLPDDFLVIHLRSGDVFTNWPSTHPQNPLVYYLFLLQKFSNKNTVVISEDEKHPFLETFKKLKVPVMYMSTKDSYTFLLRAKNLATSGAGSFAISAAFCSRNVKRYFCTDLYIENSLNPTMLKDHLEVYMLDLSDKYIKVGEWNNSPQVHEKLFNCGKDLETLSFRRL